MVYDVQGELLQTREEGTVFGMELPTSILDNEYHPIGAVSSRTLLLDLTPASSDTDPLELSRTTYDVDQLGRVWGVRQDNLSTSGGLWRSGIAAADKNAAVKFYKDGKPEELVRQAGLDFDEGDGSNLRGITSYHFRSDGKLDILTSKTDRSSTHPGLTGPGQQTIVRDHYDYNSTTGTPEHYVSEFYEPNLNKLLEESRDFHADIRDRLGEVAVTPSAPEPQGHYTYDAAGNRLTANPDDNPSATDVGPYNRVAEANGYGYLYDNEGRVIERTSLDPGATVQDQKFSYDHRGRLTKVEQYSDTGATVLLKTVEYAYDALNRRIGERVTDVTTDPDTTTIRGYVFDGDQELLTLDLSDGFQGVLTSNFYGPLGDLNAVDVSLNGTQTAWTFADPAGAIRTVARFDGTDWLFQHRLSDEFGVSYATIGDSAGQTDDYLNAVPQSIAGMQKDAATGLFLAGDHWYDPSAGRFLTPDAGTDGGGYAFVPDNPMDLANGDTPNRSFIDWKDIEGPGAFDTLGSIEFGVIDSTPIGWFIPDHIRAQTNNGYYIGLGVGIVGQIGLGNWSVGVLEATQAGKLATIGARAYQGYAAADAALGVGTSTYAVGDSLVNGKPFNPLSLTGFAPLAGYALGTLKRAGKYLRTFDDVAPNAGPSPRTPVGRSGQQHSFPNPNAPQPRNLPTTINGRNYSGHAIDRMQERGFVPSVVENAIKTGTATLGKTPGTTVFTDLVNNLRVIVDTATGRVITVIPGV